MTTKPEHRFTVGFPVTDAALEKAGFKVGDHVVLMRVADLPTSVADAGRKGGNRVKETQGPDFFSRIGRKGGRVVKKSLGQEHYAAIGRKGGQARAKRESAARAAAAQSEGK